MMFDQRLNNLCFLSALADGSGSARDCDFLAISWNARADD